MANFTIPRFRIQDAAGNAIVGGHIHFYETGTTTPKNTYQDSALTVPNTNPVVSGSDGWTPEVWMVSEAYKMVVEDDTGAVLKTYDPYYPAWTVDGTKLVGTSADADPAITGTNSSTGPGVQAVNSGAGHALWVEGDTSSPAKAALHVVPQDNLASSPVAGDLQVMTAGGGLVTYDGVANTRILGCADKSDGSLSVTTSLTGISGAKYAIQANRLRPGALIRVSAQAYLSASVGSPTIDLRLYVGGVEITAHPVANAVQYTQWHIDFLGWLGLNTITWRVSSAGDTPSLGVIMTSPEIFYLWGITSLDPSIANDIELKAIRTGGTSASISVNLLITEIDG